MTEVFRRRVLALLVDRKILNDLFARNLMSWKHSGFSIDNSVRILDATAQENLAEYISRPPISAEEDPLRTVQGEGFVSHDLFGVLQRERTPL